jgi:hypothetical protein
LLKAVQSYWVADRGHHDIEHDSVGNDV